MKKKFYLMKQNSFVIGMFQKNYLNQELLNLTKNLNMK